MSGRRRACGVGAHTERGRHRHRHGEPGQQRRRGHSQPPRGTRRVGRDRPASQWRALGLVNWRPLGGGPGPGRRVGRRAPRVPPAAQPTPAPPPPPSSGSSAASTTSAASAPSADRRWRWQAMRRGGGAGAAGARRGAALRRCAPEASQPANVLLPARRGCGRPAGACSPARCTAPQPARPRVAYTYTAIHTPSTTQPPPGTRREDLARELPEAQTERGRKQANARGQWHTTGVPARARLAPAHMPGGGGAASYPSLQDLEWRLVVAASSDESERWVGRPARWQGAGAFVFSLSLLGTGGSRPTTHGSRPPGLDIGPSAWGRGGGEGAREAPRFQEASPRGAQARSGSSPRPCSAYSPRPVRVGITFQAHCAPWLH